MRLASAGEMPWGRPFITALRDRSKFSHTVRRIIDVPAINAAISSATPTAHP